MSLEHYQRAFLKALFTDRPGDALRSVAGYLAENQEPGLDIHRRNIVFGVVDQLRRAYPACAAVLGEANFRFLGRQYMLAHPPDDPDMRHIGRAFAEFLATRDEVAELGFIPDLARLERLVARARRARPERAELTLGSRFPLAEIYQRFLDGALSEPMALPVSAEPREIRVTGDGQRVSVNAAPG